MIAASQSILGKVRIGFCILQRRNMQRTLLLKLDFRKLPAATLAKVADELFQEFQNTGLNIPQPSFKKAHRWVSAFPAASIEKEEKCLWDGKKRLAICGDFCVCPYVEGAILSGIAAASKFTEIFSWL